MVLTRGNIQSLVSKIHKETSGKGMDDDVPAVIRRAQGGKLSAARPRPKPQVKTLEDFADLLRGNKGAYAKEKAAEKEQEKTNAKLNALSKAARGMFGAKYAKGGFAGGDQPAALSEGEYVIPADVVSMLGDGNSAAGAKILDQLCKHVRKQKGKHLAKGRQAPPLI